ncbi:MAG: T9SS type A sorting domain-containing protein [Ignavibacteriaceae bacterium]|nr:T9SS type A sorting domain-containing protein [Ignavibacteriaceae bacterium]
MDDTGKFVIVWEDHRFGLSNADVIAQRFFSNGAINGSNYKIVRDGTNYGQEWPAVAANNSTIIFSWDDNRRLKGYDVYAKRVGWDWSGVVSVPEGEELISSFQLLQNYPNPFNPNTRIRWSVPNACYQTLRVYDVLGREIATLVDEYRNAGSYDTEFDAGKLSSGIYLYKLQAGNLIQTKKMVVSK